MKYIRYAVIAATLMLAVLVGALFFAQPQPVEAIQFSNIVSASSIRSTTHMLAGTDLRLSEQSLITVTNGAAFTPTGSYQPITAAGEVTPTISTGGGTTGDLLVLVNEGSNTINIADSGTAKLSTALALGQFDTIVLIFDDTNWIELTRADN